MQGLLYMAMVGKVVDSMVEVDEGYDMTGSKSMKLGIDLRNKKWISISKTRRTIWNN